MNNLLNDKRERKKHILSSIKTKSRWIHSNLVLIIKTPYKIRDSRKTLCNFSIIEYISKVNYHSVTCSATDVIRMPCCLLNAKLSTQINPFEIFFLKCIKPVFCCSFHLYFYFYFSHFRTHYGITIIASGQSLERLMKDIIDSIKYVVCLCPGCTERNNKTKQNRKTQRHFHELMWKAADKRNSSDSDWSWQRPQQ